MALISGATGSVIWFTGLSGAGKTTLAHKVKAMLQARGYKLFILDGDVLRGGLNSDLGFTLEHRSENIRRAAEVAKLFCNEGYCVLATFISPSLSDRQNARHIISEELFYEVYVKCPVEVCAQRDVKGLYQKAKAGLIGNVVGIDLPYEEPLDPSLVVDSKNQSVDQAATQVLNALFISA